MNLGNVMDQLGDALDTIDGLRVYRYPPDSLVPPAAVVTYPDTIEYSQAYRGGMNRISIPVVVVLGKVSDRASAGRMGPYASDSGARSIKEVLDNGAYTAMDVVTVTTCEFEPFAMGGADYISALFMVDVVGQGR